MNNDFTQAGRNRVQGVFHPKFQVPELVIASFRALCVEKWVEFGHPELPAIAQQIVKDTTGGPANQDLTPAIMEAARRGQKTPNNAFHNSLHTAQVTIFAGYYGATEAATKGAWNLPPLDARDRLVLVLAALGHDLGHPGGANPPGDLFAYEKEAFANLQRVMKKDKVPQEVQDRVRLMLLATSARGPHAYVKEVAKAFRKGQTPDHETIKNAVADQWWKQGDREGFCTQIDELEPLIHDKKALHMALILHVADLTGSVLGSDKTSVWLSKEMGVDMTTPASHSYFLGKVVGEWGLYYPAAEPFNQIHAELLERYTLQAEKLAPVPP